MAKPKIKVADLKTRISVTDHVQKPVGCAEIEDSRIELFSTYARMGQPSDYRINSYRVNQADRDKASHEFVIRQRHDYEIGPKNWIYRDYRGRREWFKVLSASDIDDAGNFYTRILASLWERDSDLLDPETQDIPCEDVVPDQPISFDYRDVGW